MTNVSALDYVEGFTVSKSLNDRMWKLSFTLDGSTAPEAMIGIRAFATDYNDTEHCLFVGFIPGADYTYKLANNKISVTAFDYTWYLTAQHVPKAYWEVDLSLTVDYHVFVDFLGGENWENVTGVELANIFNSLDGSKHVWNPKTTKMEAIEDMADVANYMILIMFEEGGLGTYTTTMYYTQLPDVYLPAQVTFTEPSDYVISINKNENYLENYNRVIVYGTNPSNGNWYTATNQTAAVTAGEEKPIEYVFESSKLTTQNEVETKCDALYAILNGISATTYSAVLTNRFDLKLMQLVKFVGYTGIPETDMRIISIAYHRELNNDHVDIQFTADQSFADLRLLARYLETDPIQQQQQVIEDKLITGLGHIAIGEVTAVDGSIATVTLERSGNSIEARIVE